MANTNRTRSSRYSSNNSNRSSSNLHSSNSKTKSNVNIKKIKRQNNMILSAIIIILLVLCFIFMGWFITLVLTIGLCFLLLFKALIDQTKSKSKRRLLYFLMILFLFFSIVALAAVGAFMGFIMIKAPKFDTTKLSEKESTIIYDKDGKEFARLGTEMRENVHYEKLPDVLVDALISIEDSRFFDHNGVDAPRFAKAVIGQVTHKGVASGASTLSMQVIKNSFTSTESHGIEGIIRKFTDIYLAVFKLEKQYSKEEIIEFYVNNHYLGNNSYGVEQACQVYFNKSVSDINLSEAALLVGMFQAPSSYDPYNYPKNAEDRRATVLYQMRKHGYITEDQEEIANSIPVSSLISSKPNINSAKYQGFIDTLVEDIEKRYNVNPYSTPMIIYSTLDVKKQKAVEKILDNGYKWPNKVMQCGVAALDIKTGRIVAIGAGRHREGSLQYNYATQIKRQPGSTAKPLFDYGPGIELDNWSTYEIFVDEPWSYSGGKEMNNWDGSYYGTMTLRKALSLSRNVPALKAFQRVVKDAGKDKVIDFVTKLGIQPELCPAGYTYNSSTKKCISNKDSSKQVDRSLHEAHSIGAFNGASPIQMAAAYAAFGNGGYYHEPHAYTKIVFRDTNETVKSSDLEKSNSENQVMSDATAYMISSVLQNVVTDSMKVENVHYAAKTGTSNYDEATKARYGLADDAVNDGWTIAYDTKTVFGMWFGYKNISSKYYNRMIQQALMRDSLAKTFANVLFEHDGSNFKMPKSVVKVGIEKGSNPAALPSPGTPKSNIVYELFKKGTEPKETSEAYSALANPGYLNVSYNEGSNTVNLSWGKVVPSNKKDSYGAFGYYVYFNGTNLGFTQNTSYTINNPTTPYGTYKVVAAFKNYSKNQSSGITKSLQKEKEEEELNYTYEVYPKTISVADVANFEYNSTYAIFLNGKKISPDSINHNPDLTETPGVQTITYTAMHKGNEIKFSVKITVN